MKNSKIDKKSLSICVVFGILIFSLSIWSLLLPVKAFSENENRFLAEMPKFSKETLFSGEFAEEYEAFITDQFPIRDKWITLKTLTEMAMLKQESNGVYFGKEGYLIEIHSNSDVDKKQLTTNTNRLIAFLKDMTKKMGKEHLKVMLVPTANMILTDKLPKFATGFDQFSYLAGIKKELEALHLEDLMVDVSETLTAHNKEKIFFRTDHHWTALGAYYAYAEWAKKSGLQPSLLENSNEILASNNFYGTVYSKVNKKVAPDTILLYEPKEKKSYHVEYNLGEKVTDTLYEKEQLKGKDKYAVFLGGNNAVVNITSENKNGKKLLIIKDSYAHCFTPFVVDHYEETQMIDLRYFNMSVSEYIDKNGFDDVLFLYNIPNFIKDRNMSNLTL